jgi:transposase-like protein
VDQRSRELRRAIHQVPRRGSRRRYPAGLRAALVAYAAEAHDRGQSNVDTCRRLGLPLSTLGVWLGALAKRDRTGAGQAGRRTGGGVSVMRFRPVVVRSTPPEGAARVVSAGVIVAPGGYRIEGLSLTELVAVVKELAC